MRTSGSRPLLVLLHSPAVGPSTWRPVATELRARGRNVRVPTLRDVATGDPPYWPRAARRSARRSPTRRPDARWCWSATATPESCSPRSAPRSATRSPPRSSSTRHYRPAPVPRRWHPRHISRRYGSWPVRTGGSPGGPTGTTRSRSPACSPTRRSGGWSSRSSLACHWPTTHNGSRQHRAGTTTRERADRTLSRSRSTVALTGSDPTPAGHDVHIGVLSTSSTGRAAGDVRPGRVGRAGGIHEETRTVRHSASTGGYDRRATGRVR